MGSVNGVAPGGSGAPAPVTERKAPDPASGAQAGADVAKTASPETTIQDPYNFKVNRDQWQAFAKVWKGSNLKLDTDGKYEIKFGDSLYGIARRLKEDYKNELKDKSLDAIVNALKQANPKEIKGKGSVILASTAKQKHLLDIAGTLDNLGVERKILEQPAEARGYYKVQQEKQEKQKQETVSKVQKAIDEHPEIQKAMEGMTFEKPEDYAAFYQQHEEEELFKDKDGNALFTPEEFKTWGEAQLAKNKAESAASNEQNVEAQKSTYEKVDGVLQGTGEVPQALRESLATAEQAGDVDYAKFYDDHDSEFAQLTDENGNRLISKPDFVAYGKYKTEVQPDHHTDNTAGARPVKKYDEMNTAEKDQAYNHVNGKIQNNSELLKFIEDQEQADKNAAKDTDYGALYDKNPSLFQQADITPDELKAYGEIKKQKAAAPAAPDPAGAAQGPGDDLTEEKKREILRKILQDLTDSGQGAIENWLQKNGSLTANNIQSCYDSPQIQECQDLQDMTLPKFKDAINDMLAYSGEKELTLSKFQELRKLYSA